MKCVVTMLCSIRPATCTAAVLFWIPGGRSRFVVCNPGAKLGNLVVLGKRVLGCVRNRQSLVQAELNLIDMQKRIGPPKRADPKIGLAKSLWPSGFHGRGRCR